MNTEELIKELELILHSESVFQIEASLLTLINRLKSIENLKKEVKK